MLSFAFTVPTLDASGPLSLATTELEYEPTSRSTAITVALQDDDIALEAPETLSLGILLTSSECYDLTITSTQITILDDDGMCGLTLPTIANICAWKEIFVSHRVTTYRHETCQ